MEGWRQRRMTVEDHSTNKGNYETGLTLTGLLMEGLGSARQRKYGNLPNPIAWRPNGQNVDGWGIAYTQPGSLDPTPPKANPIAPNQDPPVPGKRTSNSNWKNPDGSTRTV